MIFHELVHTFEKAEVEGPSGSSAALMETLHHEPWEVDTDTLKVPAKVLTASVWSLMRPTSSWFPILTA